MTIPAITTVTNDTIPTASQTVFEENAVTRNVNAATDNVIMPINFPIDIIANDACSSFFVPAQLDRARIAILDTANKAVTIPTAIAISYNDEILDKTVNAITEPVKASIKWLIAFIASAASAILLSALISNSFYINLETEIKVRCIMPKPNKTLVIPTISDRTATLPIKPAIIAVVFPI